MIRTQLIFGGQHPVVCPVLHAPLKAALFLTRMFSPCRSSLLKIRRKRNSTKSLLSIRFPPLRPIISRDPPATGVCIARLEDVETMTEVGGNVHDGTGVVQVVVVLRQITLAYP
jgi:hypothetical protein